VFIFLFLVPLLGSCSADISVETPTPLQSQSPQQDEISIADSALANVLSVTVAGRPSAYQFAVEVSSPDTGCMQYADWWEVLSEDGQLLYRRVLLHSHVDEQPFIRSGGPVPANDDTVVFIRAHMNTVGYGGSVLMGSVSTGFVNVQLEKDFATEVESLPPLPDGCAF